MQVGKLATEERQESQRQHERRKSLLQEEAEQMKQVPAVAAGYQIKDLNQKVGGKAMSCWTRSG